LDGRPFIFLLQRNDSGGERGKAERTDFNYAEFSFSQENPDGVVVVFPAFPAGHPSH